jgi:hypothetical protein
MEDEEVAVRNDGVFDWHVMAGLTDCAVSSPLARAESKFLSLSLAKIIKNGVVEIAQHGCFGRYCHRLPVVADLPGGVNLLVAAGAGLTADLVLGAGRTGLDFPRIGGHLR